MLPTKRQEICVIKPTQSIFILNLRIDVCPLTAPVSLKIARNQKHYERQTGNYMTGEDKSFLASKDLEHAIELLKAPQSYSQPLPESLPENGVGEIAALDQLAPDVLGGAARLGSESSLAHMDPPTPWISWAIALWNASLNQNLLHEATSPFATEAERLVIDWLLPFFGMQDGHFCSGSTLANLTSLWAARDAKSIKKVVASEAAHISIEKSAKILGLEFDAIPVDEYQRIAGLPQGGLDDTCLVLTAGTTATGTVDPLDLAGHAKWTHMDAAWAGPLRLSPAYARLLDGIDLADSIAISAHKWFFQPKESAFVMFRDAATANAAISFGSSYLAKPNIGVQGSRGAAAIPLMATLLAWGRQGMAKRIEHAMSLANWLSSKIEANDHLELWRKPETAITVFRPARISVDEFEARAPDGMLSTCSIDNQRWLRSVAANPLADIERIYSEIDKACRPTR